MIRKIPVVQDRRKDRSFILHLIAADNDLASESVCLDLVYVYPSG
jgi:hypothetical protein